MEVQRLEFQNYVDGFVGRFFSGDIQILLSALLILLIGWLIAKGLQRLTANLLMRTNWDERLLGDRRGTQANAFFAKLVYYIVMLFVLLLVLDTLGLSSALRPLNNLVDRFVAAIPKVILAGIIGYIGYMVALIVSNLVALSGNLIDNWVDRTGFKGTDRLVNIIRKIVFVVVFVPFIIQALATLDFEAISAPATALLYDFTDMIGNVLVAIAVLFIFIWGGNFIKLFIRDLLVSMNFDQQMAKIGLDSVFGPGQSMSNIIAGLVYFFIVFFGVITAVDILELEQLSIILNELLFVTGQILFGLVILVIGNLISKAIYNALIRGKGNEFVANVGRYASLALFAAIALQQMGIADDIVELAFGLTLGSIAVVIALAYGLGGREAAGRHFQEILDKFKRDDRIIR